MKMVRYAALAFFGCFLVAAMPSSVNAQLFKRHQKAQSHAAIPVTVAEIHAAEVAQPPVVEATAKKPGAAFCIAVRMELAKSFRKQGHGFLKARQLANQASDEVIATLIADAETLSGVKVVGTAIGDGKIIDAIIDFFKSPQGQALIEALIKLILSLLATAEPLHFWGSSLAAWNA
jgi:hypothetical protein